MTTQREVIGAFASFEESPRRASNFRLVESDEAAQRAYLVGGRHAVYAKREPLSQLIVYASWRDTFGWRPDLMIRNGTVRRQAQLVRNLISGDSFRDSWPERHDDSVEVIEEPDETPTVDDFDDLTEY